LSNQYSSLHENYLRGKKEREPPIIRARLLKRRRREVKVDPMLGGEWKIPCLVVVATPLWPSVGVKPNTSKVGDLEPSGTPEWLELDSKAQNTSH
jgi:hypothetical protein